MIAWFGILGIGSIYYLMYAIDHGLSHPLAEQITAITPAAVTVSGSDNHRNENLR